MSDRATGREAMRAAWRRFRGDRRGNVLAMSAAALFPLMAVIGGAIDLSRLYMASTRLQQACDAGALAGRRAMADVNVLADSERTIATNYFRFNFPNQTYAAGVPTISYARGGVGTVVGTATLVVPMTIMKVFGFATKTLSVSCQSTLIVPNTDVMFVLDVTGSMNDPANSSDNQSKIAGLKQAVKNFYSALGPGSSSGPGRVRYGFMPYSSNVNVGKIVYNLNRGYITGGNGSETASYRSRLPVLSDQYYATSYGPESSPTPAGTSNSSSPPTWANLNRAYSPKYPETLAATADNCAGKNAPPDDAPTNSSSSSTQDEQVAYPDTTQTRTYNNTQTQTTRSYRYNWNKGGTPNNACRLQYGDSSTSTTTTSTTTRSVTWQQKFVRWNYTQASFDVSSIVQNNTGANPTYFTGYAPDTTPNRNYGYYVSGNYAYLTVDNTPNAVTWGGCIEEASTDNSITASSSLTIPSGANDLNIDLIPNSASTRWKPYLPAIQFDDDGYWLGRDRGWIANGFAACPREASPLTQYQSDYVSTTKSSPSFNTYVDSLSAVGGTYHDIGMIWGARFLSQSGIFGATNADSTGPGGFQISRHIVFMTDGTLDTRGAANDPWGVNSLEGRIAPANTKDTDLNNIHRRRMNMICNAMKGKGFTVWIVGFGISTMPQELQDCASDANHWSLASDSAALQVRFQQIAQTIGGLRLSQ